MVENTELKNEERMDNPDTYSKEFLTMDLTDFANAYKNNN